MNKIPRKKGILLNGIFLPKAFRSFSFFMVMSLFHILLYIVCSKCQPTALLRTSASAQGGQMALSVVYFRITHRLGRPHYVWDEYLYSVL